MSCTYAHYGVTASAFVNQQLIKNENRFISRKRPRMIVHISLPDSVAIFSDFNFWGAFLCFTVS